MTEKIFAKYIQKNRNLSMSKLQKATYLWVAFLIDKESLYFRHMMPVNFYGIITAQAILYIVFAWYYKKFPTRNTLIFSVIAGIVIGFLFNIISSILGFYTYLRDTALIPVRPWNLSLYELLVNGVISFGLTIITAQTLPQKVVTLRTKTRLITGAIFLLLWIVSIFIAIHSPHASVMLMIASGMFIISAGELLLILCNKGGPLVQSMTLTSVKLPLQGYCAAVIIGAFYELANLFFPFWVWLPGSTLSPYFIESLIIIAGYYALLHPMMVLWVLITKKA